MLSFLGKVDTLNIYEAMKTCHEHRQFKEEAYLLAKFGKEEQAIEVLISNCSDFAETVDFALQLNISDTHYLWDMLISKSVGNT